MQALGHFQQRSQLPGPVTGVSPANQQLLAPAIAGDTAGGCIRLCNQLAPKFAWHEVICKVATCCQQGFAGIAGRAISSERDPEIMRHAV
jgi:hypothetical protein